MGLIITISIEHFHESSVSSLCETKYSASFTLENRLEIQECPYNCDKSG